MNSLMITPIGVGIIGVYSAIVCFVILFPLSRRLQHSRWKWWVLSTVGFPFLAAPWAEEAWIAWHFNEACKDAGVKVVRQVEVDGYADGTNQYERKSIKTGPLFKDDPTRQLDFEKQGYRFYEDLLKDGGARHLEREGNQMMVTILDRPLARYHYKFLDTQQEMPVGRRLKKFGYQVLDSETNEVLGSDTRFVRYPNLAESVWLQYFGPSALSCNGPLDAPEKKKRSGLIYEYVLKSTKSR